MRWLSCISITVSLALVVAMAPATGAASAVTSDINGDGAGDLLVGVPLEGLAGSGRAGTVNVLYSNGNRLSTAGNIAVNQAKLSVGEVEPGDLFGSAVELVDVDGDGHADAVIGSSGEDANAGAVTVIPGSPDGLVLPSATRFRQGESGVPGTPAPEDFFGFNITSGDFDGDGYGDIAVGAPFDDIDGLTDAGTVTVVPGSASGLDTASAVLLHQSGSGAAAAESGDFFGWSLTTGDFDGDGIDDLAVGAPGQDRLVKEQAGAATVFPGSPTGLSLAQQRTVSQAGAVKNRAEADDLFGFSVAATDLDCDGRDDLLVGTPNEALGSRDVVAGLVNVLMGSPTGITVEGNVRLAQGRGGVPGSRDFNQFGAAMAAGDFDGDGCGDIAISAHTTDVGGNGSTICALDPTCAAEAGAVVVIHGSPRWPAISTSARFTQRGPIGGTPDRGDFFGRTLTTVDANGDGRDELVIGVPREDVAGKRNSGKITVLRGTRKGLTTERDYSFSQAGRVKGRPEARDQFGSSLADATS